MMGAGKSTVGRLLAEKAHRTFQDTDQLIVQRLGRPIGQLFSVYGQEAFRDHETSILRSLEPQKCVLATGGGIVLREANWIELRRLGVVAYLDIPVELLIERLEKSTKKRPLLAVDDWKERVSELLCERRPLYEKADIVLQFSDEDHGRAADKLFEAFELHR